MQIINSESAPKAVGPYSHAVITGNLMFLSGQIGLNPKTQELADGLEEQTRQIIKNIQAVLAEMKLTLSQVVKTEIFLTNIADFTKVNEIYGEYFSKTKPARITVECSNLPKNALIEISAIAEI